MPERLQKILSAYGVASRREAERLIREGRVFVNGAKAEIGHSADPEQDEITVDGNTLASKDAHVYIMLNKPRGYITTASDDRGRKTVMELVSDLGVNVYPAGRLDMESEGLLLLTNDGLFANAVTHPSFNKVKTYEVRVRGDIDRALGWLRGPIVIDAHEVKARSVNVIKKLPGGGILSMSINEGRNRQIRKMCAECGLEVSSLVRVSIGKLELGSLPSGKWRRLSESELKSIYSLNRKLKVEN